MSTEGHTAGATGKGTRVEEPTRLTLITRRECHLCAEMASVIDAVARAIAVNLEVRDVDADAHLRGRYGEEVPVLLVNGRKAFKYRVNADVLIRRLRRERRWARLRALLGRPAT